MCSTSLFNWESESAKLEPPQIIKIKTNTMTAKDMATSLRKRFWCFDTYTETSPTFAERMAIKNALKHC